MLIRNVEELRMFLGRAVNASFEFDSLQPFIMLAQDEYLKKGLGFAYFNELDIQCNGVEGATLSPDNAFILRYVQRALAFYTYHKYLPYAIGSDGDNGLQEMETDKTKPVRIGVLEKRQRETIENASVAMETILSFLFELKHKYPTFWNSDFGIKLKTSWFGTAQQLSDALPLVGDSHRLLLTLNRYFTFAERSKISPVIGKQLLISVKNYHLNPSNDEVMGDLYRLTKQAIAWLAYDEALVFLNITQTGKGSLRVLSEFDGINNAKAPDADQWTEYKRNVKVRTEGAMGDLVGFLNKNAETFPDFKNQLAYKISKGRLPDNSKYKSIFRMN